MFAGAIYMVNVDELDKAVVLLLTAIFLTLNAIHDKIGK